MRRRILMLVLAFAIAMAGYQPSFGVTVVVDQPEVGMGMDGHCPNAMPDDCCDKTQKDKRLCVWNDACAARCHVNAGLEVVFFVPLPRSLIISLLPLPEPPPLHAARAGPHFRPPIL